MKSTTFQAKGPKTDRKWFLINLEGQTLGRMCTQIAQILMGKSNPRQSFNRDDGDCVVAINAKAITVTGTKAKTKIYYHYTNYPGGIREATFQELMKKDPRLVIRHGVYGMLPKNKLRDLRIKRLKIFVGQEHPYADKIKS
ncbi:MAG: 50S ribosomal protein L13 [Candidatus Shapirobacteria bacterium]|jgi:large subunit ribosomal protein L13